MKKQTVTTCVAALAIALLASCAVDPNDNVEELDETTQALAASSAHIVWYSDATYQTVVGHFVQNCSGGKSMWGTRTPYAEGSWDSCSISDPSEPVGCYEWQCTTTGSCVPYWCPLEYQSCKSC
jgi:hypothetical protein